MVAIVNYSTKNDLREAIVKKGFSVVWREISHLIEKSTDKKIEDSIFNLETIDDLYEESLSWVTEGNVLPMGKFYTPLDVAAVMSELLNEKNIHSLADVACGTGRLSYLTLKQMSGKGVDVRAFLAAGNLWVCDLDRTATRLLVVRLRKIYGSSASGVKVRTCDFLNKNCSLPENSSVISNPPYRIVKTLNKSWKKTEALQECKDLYGGFIEKIAEQASRAVILSPQTFLVAKKFQTLRNVLSKRSGEIFSFDNVPCSLFNQRKWLPTNTNNSVSVRASISVIGDKGECGYRLTPLIRFKASQRKNIVKVSKLKSLLSSTKQSLMNPLKMDRHLEPFMWEVLKKNSGTLHDLMNEKSSNDSERKTIYVSTSARYFVVSTKIALKRRGFFEIEVKDEESFYFMYALLNSSYAYMWWRAMDGGILLPKSILLRIPLIDLEENRKRKAIEVARMLVSEERKFLTYKKNAGEYQESVKFPASYRDLLNKEILGEYWEKTGSLHGTSVS